MNEKPKFRVLDPDPRGSWLATATLPGLSGKTVTLLFYFIFFYRGSTPKSELYKSTDAASVYIGNVKIRDGYKMIGTRRLRPPFHANRASVKPTFLSRTEAGQTASRPAGGGLSSHQSPPLPSSLLIGRRFNWMAGGARRPSHVPPDRQ